MSKSLVPSLTTKNIQVKISQQIRVSLAEACNYPDASMDFIDVKSWMFQCIDKGFLERGIHPLAGDAEYSGGRRKYLTPPVDKPQPVVVKSKSHFKAYKFEFRIGLVENKKSKDFTKEYLQDNLSGSPIWFSNTEDTPDTVKNAVKALSNKTATLLSISDTFEEY